MKKKIALLLFGISYKENYQHFSGRKMKIDYKNSLENYNKFIFEYYKKLGYEIDVFISTNKHKNINNLIKDYKPKNIYIRKSKIRNHIM